MSQAINQAMAVVQTDGVVAPEAGSALALEVVRLGAGESFSADSGLNDELWFVFEGTGTIDGEALAEGSAALVVAGGTGTLRADDAGLAAVRALVGPDVDRHAPMGQPERVVSIEHVEPGKATGSRSFQILLGPTNGSTRATMFVGYVPPGRAPWHYHLYDEIVWIWRGPGRYHVGDTVEELPNGAAFRIRPRQVHIVENLSEDRELAVLGIFTPAGSPSAAYLTAEVAESYAVAAR
jgi:mannose-6-phosphate isomerase-like protein (cupin superfamily)